MTEDALNVPIPPGLSETTIHDQNSTGIVAGEFLVAYSDATQTGGIFPMQDGNRRWTLVHPVTKEQFVEICSDYVTAQVEARTSDMIDAVRH